MLNPRRLGVGMEGAAVTPLPLSVTTIGPPIFIALTMRQGLLTTAYTVDDYGVGVHGAGGHGPDGVGGGSKELAGHHVEGPGAQVVGGKTVPKSTGTARNGGERLSIASATVQSASSTS